MKTALEWQSETGPGNTASVAWIKSIQADAMGAGQEAALDYLSEEIKRIRKILNSSTIENPSK